jgi:hypothetical protein
MGFDIETLYYTGIDNNRNNIEHIFHNKVHISSDAIDVESTEPWTVVQRSSGATYHTRFLHADVFDVDPVAFEHGADLVVAKAVVDLVPIGTFLNHIRPWMNAGALLYCPITFNGRTELSPSHELDDQVFTVYHESMERRDDRSGEAIGGRYAGNRLVRALDAENWEVLGAEPSDWIVQPQPDGSGYPDDEAYFMEHLLHFIEQEIEMTDVVSSADVTRWLDTRRSQLEDAELTMRAHNLDVLARKLR